MEMADGYKQIAAELIDAIQNETLDDFIGFIYERDKNLPDKLKNDTYKLQQLIKMLQEIKNKWGKLYTNIFIYKYLYFIYINLKLAYS